MVSSPKVTTIISLLLLLVDVSAFGIIDPSAVHTVHEAASTMMPHLDTLSNSLNVASASATNPAMEVLDAYKQSLATHPLITKMLTGGTLAVCGDAIAQSQTDEEYNKRRAASFAGFDCVYRAVQHFSFPAIVQQCQGQYIGAIVAATPGLNAIAHAMNQGDALPAEYYYGAMEQTLASQLGIVPFFYYPVFYTITAFVQGLDSEEAVQRAKDTFIPLMKRNLLFWIPVQFIQFGYIDENLQIPFLSVAGLAWTFIISLFAGNAKAATPSSDEKMSVQMNMKSENVITVNDIQKVEQKILQAVDNEVNAKKTKGAKMFR